MAAELGLLSMNQIQKLAQSQRQQQQEQQQNPNLTSGSWMWNGKRIQEEDDSWEVRAFAEDTGNIMGTTWPPRSYTCTFCRREFRSAQALGGHMNVHRRDRARLRQSPPGSIDPSSSSTSSSTLIIPTQDFVTNGGLCLLYPLPSPNSVFQPTSVNGCMNSTSTVLSITPYPTSNFMSSCPPPSINFPVVSDIHASLNHSAKAEPSVSVENDNDDDDDNNRYRYNKEEVFEELDLELRLGTRP